MIFGVEMVLFADHIWSYVVCKLTQKILQYISVTFSVILEFICDLEIKCFMSYSMALLNIFS